MTIYRKKPQKPEEALQCSIVEYVARVCPEVILSASMNGMYIGSSGNSFGYIAKMKKMGMLVGFCDLQLFWAPSRCLLLECKIKPNKPTQDQANVMADLTVKGFPCEVVYSLDEAISAMRLHGVPNLLA